MQMSSEYDREDPAGMTPGGFNYDPYNKPYPSQSMPQSFLNECSYTMDKKKSDLIGEKVERYFNELPDDLKYNASFGKLDFMHLE